MRNDLEDPIAAHGRKRSTFPGGFAVSSSAASRALIERSAWEELSRDAVEPNPFFSHWFARASLVHCDPWGRARLATLTDAGHLNGAALFKQQGLYAGRPLPHTELWLQDNAFLGTPVVRAGYERPFWEGLFEWYDQRLSGGLLLSLPCQTRDGPVLSSLLETCARQNRECGIVHSARRALLRSPFGETDALAALGTKRRKELQRQRRRLGEQGRLTFERRRKDGGIDDWIDEFLALEQAGWKGRQRSALAASPGKARMFRQVMHGAGEAGRLERLALRLDGKPVAMLATFLTPPGAFAFKTAFDENYARFSPGVLLQLENLALLEDPSIEWCDSCAVEDHPMIDRLWPDRREVVTVNVALGTGLRRAAGSALIRYEARRFAARRAEDER